MCNNSHSLAVGLAVFCYSIGEFILGKKKPLGCGSLIAFLLFTLLVFWEYEKSCWAKKRISNLVILFNSVQYKKGVIMNFSVDNSIVCSLVQADQFGDPEAVQVPPDAPPQWSVDNASAASISLAGDGVSGLLVPKGAGVVNVSVAASFGGKALNGSGQLTLVPGAVAQITLSFAAQVPAPAAPAAPAAPVSGS